MIIAECSYTQFKNLKTMLGLTFNVLVQDATPDGGAFTALAFGGSGSLAMRFVANAKPQTFDLDMPLAVYVNSVSV